jgi:hypothetical protein
MERAQVNAAPPKLTPEQWKRIGDALCFAYGSAELEIDGFKLLLQVVHAGPLKLTIVFFVNGWMRGEWLGKDCEERRRFFRPVTLRSYSYALKAKWIKALGKKRAHEMFELDKTCTFWMSDWPSFGPLKRHLVKFNTSIRLVSIGGVAEAQP